MLYSTPDSYTKAIDLRFDKTLGYYYFLDKEHPLAYTNGKVYYHRHVASIKQEAWITGDYDVHHIDEDKTNNSPDNLQIVLGKEHHRFHVIHGNYAEQTRSCEKCGKEFITNDNNRFCSKSCAASTREKGGIKFKITKGELEALVWEMPTVKIAEKLGCSDVMVGKICKEFEITKPPRGYWRKQEAA